MGKKLTEEMVIARTKISDLNKVKRLNCWGCDLEDVSLLRKMPNVEVLSLSINKINSLCDFQYCRSLQELFIRQNDIPHLNQICYLQGLVNLRSLWLGENPCTDVEDYRLTVLRALPQVQKLDNYAVTNDELRDATRKGRALRHPEDVDESEEEEACQQQGQYGAAYQEYAQPPEPEGQEPAEHCSRDEAAVEGVASATQEETFTAWEPVPPHRRQEVVREAYVPPQQDVGGRRMSNSYEQEYQKQPQYYEKAPPGGANTSGTDDGTGDVGREAKLTASSSTNSIKEYTNGVDRHQQPQHCRYADEASVHSHESSAPRRDRFAYSAVLQPPFNRRPVTRNSNILSAALCLVKELDYPGLEVVEMAVRCRMDELGE